MKGQLWSGSTRGVHTPLYLPIHAKFTLRVLLVVIAVLLLGILVTVWNIYQLRTMQETHLSGFHSSVEGIGTSGEEAKPILWLHAKRIESGYLDHILRVFERIGYRRGGPDSDWDVLWAHDYPFTELAMEIGKMKPHQKLNHFPGTGFITQKVHLATSSIDFVPKAFKLPQQSEEFKAWASKNPDKLWVQKSNAHRGIKVKPISELDLSAANSFIQEFIDKPFLIDGRKFDIGVYIVVTSVDPLRIYIVDDETLVRFCSKDYHPIDYNVVDKYVIGDDYTPMWQMPSFEKLYNEQHYSFRESLNSYIRSQGLDSSQIYPQVYSAIRSVFLNKYPQLLKSLNKFKHKNTFFELMRFDFVLDEKLKLFLMEVNMSPNLSSNHFLPNKYMYEHVIYNILSVVGIARNVKDKIKDSSQDAQAMQVSEKRILVRSDICGSPKCATCISSMYFGRSCCIKQSRGAVQVLILREVELFPIVTVGSL
ncbi:tubulin polyglutamylase TTLL6-like isoform X2 [Acanthaster planci]|uniref:Tubulin polyglutamylase TTLL6-like isoform X2 n=1 Tax=Acanthaster planci TaxID=133434 RepID=A0A8B7ZY31_ACAPL|nr:tubulin polyglutamylase TTLL6-like isoform X2 [Acanthaster planci]